MIPYKCLLVVTAFVQRFVLGGNIPPPPPPIRGVAIRKCCAEPDSVLGFVYRDGDSVPRCQRADRSTPPFRPTFVDDAGVETAAGAVPYEFVYGFPNCTSRSLSPAYAYPDLCDRLVFLPDGGLKHYPSANGDVSACAHIQLDESHAVEYNSSVYCADNVLINQTRIGAIALLCVPTAKFPWHDVHSVMARVVNPLCRALAIVCLLIVAIVYVVLPQLCDLVGNIVTTITICLIFVQVADIIQIYDEYHSETSYLVSNSVMYISSLGAFFWLNSLGYYIWKTFRSRNVFLRVTDGRKYCCYGLYSWGLTFSMAAMALFAHIVLDTNVEQKKSDSVTDAAIADLGAAVFMTTIVYTIIVNIFFCLSTLQIMSRMSTYGRIHHKVKYNFHLFVKLFAIIAVNWFIFILSWFNVRELLYAHIVANLLQAIGILYATVLSVKKVRYLLCRACCNEKCVFTCCRPGDPGEINDWGEEMMAMNVRC